ncbi:M23 family metallopeptidase [Thalassotalea sp. G2M2-11]|uniref:M23 family metallopeptidase n=1 Tax=Thalassotalea sp. G2M2-11 TaxID=2787627 RepID=UPI0019D0400F|nr:M23 family metallopeptidase [Thalassotalea sp. G2M2-11]
MSLTLLYRGKNVRFSMKLNKFHWISAITVFAIISGFIVHLIMSADAKPENLRYSVTQSPEQSNETGTVNQQQVLALTMKLAELQSQVLRLNALGDRLADEANIPEKEFNFHQAPPSGGPMTQHLSEQKSLDELLVEIAKVEKTLEIEEKQLTMLESLTLGHYIENTSYLSGRPITKGWLSSYFGTRKDPFTGRPATHKGVDFAGKEDSEIITTAAGVVTWAGDRYGYGKLIEINHGKGLKTRYGHNKKILVKVGDVVSKGQVIGRMGSTGRSTGPHVHYEILRNNTQINPIKYVYRKAK